ncbi:hypothetical protein LCGC14_1604330, partial [marine sediment metagenome]
MVIQIKIANLYSSYNKNNIDKIKEEIFTKLSKINIIVQVGEYGPEKHIHKKSTAMRMLTQQYAQQHNIPRIIIDVGFIRCNKKKYLSIGVDNFKRYAKFYNKNSSPDRWNSFNLKIQPWRKDGNRILILGQRFCGYTLRIDKINIHKWYNNVFEQLSTITNKSLYFKHHPSKERGKFESKQYKFIDSKLSLLECLKDVWCVVAYATNATIESVINGVPAITLSKRNMVYDLAGHSLKDINNLPILDRTQWCNDLGYTQWS